MKRILIILGISLLMGSAFAQRGVYYDSLNFNKFVAPDTVIFIDLSHISAGGAWGAEFEWQTLNYPTGYITVGYSNFGNTFNAFADSVLMDTSLAYHVNGSYRRNAPLITKRTATPRTYGWYSNHGMPFTYFAIRVVRHTVTAGKIYWKIRQK